MSRFRAGERLTDEHAAKEIEKHKHLLNPAVVDKKKIAVKSKAKRKQKKEEVEMDIDGEGEKEAADGLDEMDGIVEDDVDIVEAKRSVPVTNPKLARRKKAMEKTKAKAKRKARQMAMESA